MWNNENRIRFAECIADLIATERVQELKDVPHHLNLNCYDHSLFVAYLSFKLCRAFRLDYVAAARGGLLHDLFLYRWKEKGSHEGFHGFTHPRAALKNARALCRLSPMEEDIIVKHMWPLTRKLPSYKESYIVCAADKICALAEMSMVYRLINVDRRLKDPVWREAKRIRALAHRSN